MDGLDRWSRIVRRPGAARIAGHVETKVPAQSEPIGAPGGRDGIRLITLPVAGEPWFPLIEITSSAARAMLEGFLRSGVGVGKVVSWQAKGYGVRRRDTIRITRE